nr:helix-turn-helix domain-containing protein [bacterium]
ERRDDIPLLARYFAARAGHQKLALSPEAEQFLLRHSWPGNVRELENAIQRALILSRDAVITMDHLRPGAAGEAAGVSPPPAPEAGTASEEPGLGQALDQLWEKILARQETQPLKMFQWLEVELARRAMEHTHGNQVRAAKLLGISRNTLRQRLGL